MIAAVKNRTPIDLSQIRNPGRISADEAAALKLMEDANAFHQLCKEAEETMLRMAKKAGEALIEAKKLRPHGSWGTWLKAHWKGSHSRAVKYMKVARKWEIVEDALSNNADLGLKAALRLIDKSKHKKNETPFDLEAHALAVRQLRKDCRRWIDSLDPVAAILLADTGDLPFKAIERMVEPLAAKVHEAEAELQTHREKPPPEIAGDQREWAYELDWLCFAHRMTIHKHRKQVTTDIHRLLLDEVASSPKVHCES